MADDVTTEYLFRDSDDKARAQARVGEATAYRRPDVPVYGISVA